jgi:conjugal transfer pilus assembly protein TraV
MRSAVRFPAHRSPALLIALATLGLGGCASMLSGLGGSPTYACKAPPGSQCTSVSGIYANAAQGPRPSAGPAVARPGSAPAAATPGTSADVGPVVRSAAIGSGSGEVRAGQGRPAATTPALPASEGTDAATANPALRTAPRVLRLWIAPWEDSDADLHEAATVNVLVDHGRWRAERVRPAPRGPHMGVTPPTKAGTPPPEAVPASRPAPAPFEP